MIRHMSWLGWVTLLLIAIKWLGKFWLQRLNQRHVRDHARAVPEAFKGIVDEATYAKCVQYTLAKAGLSQVEALYDTLLLIVVLFSRALPRGLRLFSDHWGVSAWSIAAFLFV